MDGDTPDGRVWREEDEKRGGELSASQHEGVRGGCDGDIGQPARSFFPSRRHDSTSESFAVDPAVELEALEAFYGDTCTYLDELAATDLFEPVPSVSDWSPAQHLYHIWRANASMLKAAHVLADDRIETQSPDLSESGEQVLREGSIPRGVAEAPDDMRPPENLDRDGLRETWTRSCGKLDDVASRTDAIAEADGGLPHPFWGTLTAAEWLRAAHVHSDHHGPLITDILAER